MRSKLPQKYKDSFLDKIIKKIRIAFFNSTTNNSEIEIVKAKSNVNSSENISGKEINQIVKEPDYKLKEDIKTMVENDQTLLRTLSYERLKQLASLYDEEIERNNREIEYLDYQIKKHNKNK